MPARARPEQRVGGPARRAGGDRRVVEVEPVVVDEDVQPGGVAATDLEPVDGRQRLLDRREGLGRRPATASGRRGRRPPGRCGAGRCADRPGARPSSRTTAALTASSSAAAPSPAVAGVEPRPRSRRRSRPSRRAERLDLGQQRRSCEQGPHAGGRRRAGVGGLERASAAAAHDLGQWPSRRRARRRRRAAARSSTLVRPMAAAPVAGARRTAMIPHMGESLRATAERQATRGAAARLAPSASTACDQLGRPLGGRLGLGRAPRPSPAPAARCRSGGPAPGRCSPSSASTGGDLGGDGRSATAGSARPPARCAAPGAAGSSPRRPGRPAGGPDRRTTSSSCSPVSRPSPVVARSRKITWPDCSPPRAKPPASSASST